MLRAMALALAVPGLALLSGCASSPAREAPPVVSTLPSYLWINASGNAVSSRVLDGQPKVIIVANRADQGSVRRQTDRLEEFYRDFAGRETLFLAVITGQPGRVPSNIPFVYVAEPGAFAERLGASGDFTLYVVDRAGNVLEQTNRVQNGQRVLDLMNNSVPQQRAAAR